MTTTATVVMERAVVVDIEGGAARLLPEQAVSEQTKHNPRHPSSRHALTPIKYALVEHLLEARLADPFN